MKKLTFTPLLISTLGIVLLSGCAAKNSQPTSLPPAPQMEYKQSNKSETDSETRFKNIEWRVKILEDDVRGRLPERNYFTHDDKLVYNPSLDQIDKVVVDTISKTVPGLPENTTLFAFTEINQYVFLVEAPLDEPFVPRTVMWRYNTTTKEFRKLKTTYRQWNMAPNEPPTGVGFGSADKNGEVRTLYMVSLLEDTEKTLATLPSHLSFTPALADGKPAFPLYQTQWADNGIKIPIYSAATPPPRCTLEYLPTGEFCTKRMPIFEKIFRHGQ